MEESRERRAEPPEAGTELNVSGAGEQPLEADRVREEAVPGELGDPGGTGGTEQSGPEGLVLVGSTEETAEPGASAQPTPAGDTVDLRWEAAQRRRRALAKEAREYLQAIAMAIVLAVLIMTFIGRSFVVEGASMEPTLHDRERLIVEKVSYHLEPPARGDIVVLENPRKPDRVGAFSRLVGAVQDIVDTRPLNRPYIKRVVAVAGDIIEIRDGKVILNGEVIEEPYIAEPPRWDWGPQVVPEGTVFVMGDNRNHSDDSRGSVGFLKTSRILGKAVLRYYPLNRITIFRRPSL
ncbi:MAG: signal peptidase I [Firmicutes bacterium]|nr:signal peptidase I [Bacillota bacterium]